MKVVGLTGSVRRRCQGLPRGSQATLGELLVRKLDQTQLQLFLAGIFDRWDVYFYQGFLNIWVHAHLFSCYQPLGDIAWMHYFVRGYKMVIFESFLLHLPIEMLL